LTVPAALACFAAVDVGINYRTWGAATAGSTSHTSSSSPSAPATLRSVVRGTVPIRVERRHLHAHALGQLERDGLVTNLGLGSPVSATIADTEPHHAGPTPRGALS
jgi:hypothetical protein